VAQPLEIMYCGSSLGRIVFNESPNELTATPTAGGFKLALPANLKMSSIAVPGVTPMVSNLHGAIYVVGENQQRFDVGDIRDQSYYNAPSGEFRLDLTWSAPLAALAYCERVRDGKAPRFHIELNGELCFLARAQFLQQPPQDFPNQFSQQLIRSAPVPMPGQTAIKFSAETWVKMLRRLGVAENILVEIPLSSSPPAPWDEVWRALVEARDAFEHAGPTGWKSAATAVRLALEKWQAIEPEDHGEGWTAPKSEQKKARSKRQRIDNIRWHLLQLANYAPHSGADDWSRDDALLMLSTVSALLAIRKP